MQVARVVALACALVACSGKPAHEGAGSGSGSAAAGSAAGAGSGLAEAPTAEELTLGVPDVAAYAYRKRAGETAFRDARKAEAAQDWPAVITACRAAIARDATHLDAQWLLAASLAKTGLFEEARAHLAIAVGGDFARWGERSLVHPMLATFNASVAGVEWRARIINARARYAKLLPAALLVSAGRELFAVDLGDTPRWHKLTSTGRRVIAGMRSPDGTTIAFVTRARTADSISVGLVDLAQARFTPAPGSLDIPGVITLAYTKTGFAIGGGARWYSITFDSLASMNASEYASIHATRPKLEIAKRTGRMVLVPNKTVTADWDGRGLASAIRVASSNRIVSVPSPGLIDGNTLAWSPERTHVAFVAQLDETCAPKSISAAAYMADVSTGVVTELVRASRGIAIEWFGERLAIAADDGVVLYSLDGTAPQPVTGAVKLVTPKKRARCTEVADEPPETPDDPDDPTEEDPDGN